MARLQRCIERREEREAAALVVANQASVLRFLVESCLTERRPGSLLDVRDATSKSRLSRLELGAGMYATYDI